MAPRWKNVKPYLITADEFPEAMARHSAYTLPHTVVNGRVHIEGVIDEPMMMKQLAQAIKQPQRQRLHESNSDVPIRISGPHRI